MGVKKLHAHTAVIYGDAEATGDYQLVLGDSGISSHVYMAVQTKADGWVDVRNSVLGLNFVNNLRPVDYR